MHDVIYLILYNWVGIIIILFLFFIFDQAKSMQKHNCRSCDILTMFAIQNPTNQL